MFSLAPLPQAGLFQVCFSPQYEASVFICTRDGDVESHRFSAFLTQDPKLLVRCPSTINQISVQIGNTAVLFIANSDILPFLAYYRNFYRSPTIDLLWDSGSFPMHLVDSISDLDHHPFLSPQHRPSVIQNPRPVLPRCYDCDPHLLPPFLQITYGVDESIEDTCAVDSVLLMAYYMCTPYPALMEKLQRTCEWLHSTLLLLLQNDPAATDQARKRFAAHCGLKGASWRCFLSDVLMPITRTLPFCLLQRWRAACSSCAVEKKRQSTWVKVPTVTTIPTALLTLYKDSNTRVELCRACNEGFLNAPVELVPSDFIVFDVEEVKGLVFDSLPPRFSFPNPRTGSVYRLKAIFLGGEKDGHFAIIIQLPLDLIILPSSRFPRCEWYLFDAYKLTKVVPLGPKMKLPTSHASYFVAALVYGREQ